MYWSQGCACFEGPAAADAVVHCMLPCMPCPAVTKDGVNKRTDEYGGSIENRCRVGGVYVLWQH
jgi:hypothetical protein